MPWRPRIRLPLWLALALVAAAYLVRTARRSWDFRVDAVDALVIGMLVGGVILVAIARRTMASTDDEPTDERDPEGDDAGSQR